MIALDLTPIEEAQISNFAQKTGLAPAEYATKLVREHLPLTETSAADQERDNAIALLRSWAADAPTDPEEIRKADAEAAELMENLNRNRIESGERPLFP